MTNRHPITPPPDLMQQWYMEAENQPGSYYDYITTQAARWGADQELEACCLELIDGVGRLHAEFSSHLASDLRDARRPKPPSRKQRALDALVQLEEQHLSAELATEIRNALEALPDD